MLKIFFILFLMVFLIGCIALPPTETCTKRGLPYNPCGYYDIDGKCKGVCKEQVDKDFCLNNLLGEWVDSKCINVPEPARAQ